MVLSTTIFLQFLIAFALLLVAARSLGEVARRLGQPSVIGELLAGVFLGPSLLGLVLPGLDQRLFPPAGPGAVPLQLVAQLGVVLLLLLSGMETNLAIVRQEARPAVLVAASGIVVPFLAGFAVASVLPVALRGHPDQGVVFALFIATAMSMSAIPVIVKILIDLDLMRRDVGQLILASGMLTDTAGWFLLALVASTVSAESLPLATLGLSLAGTLLLTLFAFTVGAAGLRHLFAWVDHQMDANDALLSAVLVVGLAGAAATQALHVEAFLGAFLIGMQLSRLPRVRRKARGQLAAMTLGVFAPIFFATAGLRVDLRRILSAEYLLVAGGVIVVACIGKVAGAFLGARLAGLSPWLALALGVGLNARGAVEIIVASIGLDLGILTPAAYAIVVLMAVVTSLLAPPVLRWLLRRVPPGPAEEERLRREAVQARSFLHGVGRVLVPVRDGRYALQAAGIVAHLAGEREVDVVALHVQDGETNRRKGENGVPGSFPPADVVSSSHVRWQIRSVETNDDVVACVLSEASRGYDLLVLGAAGRPPVRGLFGGITDRLIVAAPCPVFVLRMPFSVTGFQVRRVILPTAGTGDDQLAAEFAVALAKGTGADVVALHVVEIDALSDPFWRPETSRTAGLRRSVGAYAARTAQSMGDLLGVSVHPSVRTSVGTSIGREILAESHALGGDLILLAARRRLAGSDLYCGRTVEYVLQNAHCPVAVLFSTPAHGLELF